MKINLLLIIFLALLFILLLTLCRGKNLYENFDDNTTKPTNYEVPSVKRPFVNLYDNMGNKLNVILVSKPLGDDSTMNA